MLTTFVVLTSFIGATPTLAAPAWNAVNISPAMSVVYADTLADAVRKQGVKVFTASDIQTLLGLERQKALAGCGEGTDCMVELANALGCEATLVVNLARLDDGSFRGLAKLLSKSGEVRSSVKLDAGNDRALLDALERAGPLLAEPLLPKVEYTRPAVTKGWWLALGVGAVSAGVGAALLAGAQGEYARVLGAPTRADAVLIAKNGSGLQTGGWALVGFGGAALATGLVLALWPATPVTPQVAVGPAGVSFGVGGAL